MLHVRTADEDLLKDGNASVKVINDQTQPVPIQLDRYGKALSGNSIPVVLATDHDPVPVTSATLPLLGGAVGANGAIFGPIPLAGCNGVLAQVASSGTLTIIFEATVADPILGPWVTVSGTRTSNGQIDSNPQLAAVTLAWDFLLSGFAYFRIRVTAYTSGIAQIQVSPVHECARSNALGGGARDGAVIRSCGCRRGCEWPSVRHWWCCVGCRRGGEPRVCGGRRWHRQRFGSPGHGYSR